MHLALVENRVRADEDIDLAARHARKRLFLLPRGAEAADDVDRRQEAQETLRKRLVMLLREHRRRHEHRDLLAVQRRLVRRADRDFRLAESHVAAEQPVHRLRLLHVRLDLADGAQLIRRLLIRERILELALARVVR